MHELFHIVLNRKDLSKAGDLFHLKDSIIFSSLPSVIAKIQEISSSSTYIHNDNDQSVVEICIARITAALRDSNKIEQIAAPLTQLLQSCLSHDLKPRNHHTQPPHAKIASDLLACLFLNYTNRHVMSLTIPIAINFLQKNNTELQRNVSSYISLAAIENSDLLSKHVQIIIDSIITGNYILIRVLPIIYHLTIEKIHENILNLSIILQYCDVNEKNCLLGLFNQICADSAYPILDTSLQYIMDQLKVPETAPATLKLLQGISTKSKLLPHQMSRLKEINHDSTTIALTSEVILSIVQANNGKFSPQALSTLVQLLKLNNSTVQNKLLKDFIHLVSTYPYLVNQELIKELSFVNSRIFIDKLIELNRNNILNKKSDKYHGWSMNRLNTPTISGFTPSSKSLTKLNYDRNCSSNSKLIDVTPLGHKDLESSLHYIGKSNSALSKGLPFPPPLSSTQMQNSGLHPMMSHHNNNNSQALNNEHHHLGPGLHEFPPVKLRTNLYTQHMSSNAGFHMNSALSGTSSTLSNSNPMGSSHFPGGGNGLAGHETNNRMSVFEPYPMRDTVQHFCEKHLDKIKSYMEKLNMRIPLPVKCTIEERKSKKNVKLHFACPQRSSHCLYSNGNLYNLKTKYGRTWIHIMFLALQSRSDTALSTREASVSSLKNCWDILKCENKTFLTLVTSAFPSAKDHENLLTELRQTGYLNVFEFNGVENQWNCFLCNHPEKSLEFLQIQQEPSILLQGPLKEKKGKFKIFKRWRTRYFTLSGGMLISENSGSQSTLTLDKIRSVRVTKSSSSSRNIPKAFEIFTDDNSYVLKPASGKDAETWVQCLSVLVAAANSSSVKANSSGMNGSSSGNSAHIVTRTAV